VRAEVRYAPMSLPSLTVNHLLGFEELRMRTMSRRGGPPGTSLISFLVLATLCGAWVTGCGDATGPDAALDDEDLGDTEQIERDPSARAAVAEAFDTLPPRLFGNEGSENIRRIKNRVQSILSNMKETAYVHDEGMQLNEPKGIYKYDCSGFVGTFVLKDTLPTHYQRLLAGAQQYHKGVLQKDGSRAGADAVRPRAWGFYDYFDSLRVHAPQNGDWHVFRSLAELMPGDIIVARYANGWREQRKDRGLDASTGHVMIAWDVHTVLNWLGKDHFKIKVVDSSSSGHDNDTRDTLSDGVSGDDGIGTGDMVFTADDNGDVDGYYWSKNVEGKWYSRWDGSYSYHRRLEGVLFARAR